MIDKIKLKKYYEGMCEDYVKVFAEKHEMEFEGWVGDAVGGVATFGDWFFNLDDIRYDVDNDVPNDEIIKWIDYTSRCYALGCPKTINFPSWIKGAPKPYTEEELDKIEEAHRRVGEAEHYLFSLIHDASNKR